MALYLTIARPYASALFEDAKGKQAEFSAWAKVLQVLSYLMNQPSITRLTTNPKTTSEEKYELLVELITSVVASEVTLLGNKFNNFIKLLIEHKRLLAVADMLILFKQFVDQAQKVTEVWVISAFEIEQAEQEKIKATLAKRFKTSITAKFEVDKSLIGGAIIRTDKLVIDGSIKGKLASLHQSLNRVKG